MNSERFEAFKKAHPELNWKEVEEICLEDLEAGAEFFDHLLAEGKKGRNDGTEVSENQGEANR